jgi:orotidine-5'-phosphate decarboxylase
MARSDPSTAAAVESFLKAFLDRIADRVAVVKPQADFFEQLGSPGVAVLERLVERARELGLHVVLDAKRGDIGSTAAAYAAAYLRVDAPLRVDALTVNPYLGLDTLEPFLDASAEAGSGLFVLVKTSNSGSGDLQDRRLESGGVLYEALAEELATRALAFRGPKTGFSSLGVVAGATWPGESERLRELLPHSLFLVPGYGAQGAGAKEALRGFVRGGGGLREGGIVNSSRGLLFPEGSSTDDRGVWERTIDDAIDRAVGELREAAVA